MEFNKINNLLGPVHDKVPKFITKKWIEVQSQSGSTYNTSKPIRFKTSMLRSDLCDYSDAYVWVKGAITVTDPNNVNFDRRLTLKNDAPFISCISKINGELVENAEDLDIVIPMYNLLEYSKNYKKTSGSLFNYYRDKPKKHTIGNGDKAINISIRNSESFDYKTKITLILSWYKECILVGRALRNAPDPQPNPPIDAIESPTSGRFEITDCKLYVLVVTLSAENESKLLEQLKSGYRRSIK